MSVWATYLLEVAVGRLICGFFFFFSLPVMFPSETPKLPTDLPVRGFPGVWKLLLLHDSLPGIGLIPNSFVSLFIFYILSCLLLKTMCCLSGCLVSSTSVQKLFCGIYSAFKWSFNEFVGEKVVSPSYSSPILRPPLCVFFLISSASVRSFIEPISVLYWAHLCMKCSLGISDFFEEISSLSHSIVFIYFFALIAEEGFLISPCYSLQFCIQMGISFLFSFTFGFFSFHSYL